MKNGRYAIFFMVFMGLGSVINNHRPVTKLAHLQIFDKMVYTDCNIVRSKIATYKTAVLCFVRLNMPFGTIYESVYLLSKKNNL